MNNLFLTPRVRFAPSPTGFLHLGNARTALLNWLFARKIGAHFILRLDDTDTKRSEERFKAALVDDLSWLGLTYDAFVRQSERTALYAEKIAMLKADGRLYPCYETPQALDVKRKLQLAQGKPPVYDRASLALSPLALEALEAQGLKPHWRFRLPDGVREGLREGVAEGVVEWVDLMRGPLTYDTRTLSDPIVIREDGSIGFLLAGAIDDEEMGITHILRGEDHITNTAVQIQILKALGVDGARFAFGHFSLITDAQGHGFSKRLGSLSLQELQREGMHPLAVSSFLMALGTADAPLVVSTLDALVSSFGLEAYGRATPKLNIDDLWSLNAKFLHQLSYEEALPLLEKRGLATGVTALFWEVVRESLVRWEDIQQWKAVCGLLPDAEEMAGTCPPQALSDDDKIDNGQIAQETLPAEPWSIETWGTWTQVIKARTGLSGKALYHPLRIKLTGRDQGPEMKKLLPLMGRSLVLRRLAAAPSKTPL